MPNTVALTRSVEQDGIRTTDDLKLPLGISQADLELYCRHCLPGGLAAFGMQYHSQEPMRTTAGNWRDSTFLYRPNRPDRGQLTATAVREHLAGKRIVATRWPGYVDRIEFDYDHDPKDKETGSWDSFIERDLLVCSALGFIEAPPAQVLTSKGTIDYGPFDPGWTRSRWQRHAAELPGVVWRSSSGGWSNEVQAFVPGGMRRTVFLDRMYPADEVREVREVVIGLLAAAGVTVQAGYIEVFPHGNKTLRLPLGLGSAIIDPLTGSPVNAQPSFVSRSKCRDCGSRQSCGDNCPTRDKASPKPPRRIADPWYEVDDEGETYLVCGRDTLRRDLRADIAEWAARASRPIRFDDLRARLSRLTNKPGPIRLVEREDGGSHLSSNEKRCAEGAIGIDEARSAEAGPITSSRSRASCTSNLPPPVPDRGMRNETFKRLLCGWYCSAGYTPTEIMSRAEAWLLQPGHAGPLGGHRGAYLAKAMLRSVPKNLELMDGKLAIGKLQRRTPLRTHRPLSRLLDLSRERRDEALALVTADDEARIATVTDPFLNPTGPRKRGRPPLRRLAMLVGALRAALRDGAEDSIAVCWEHVEDLVGTAFPRTHPMRGVMAPASYAVMTLRQLGFLGDVITPSVKGRTAAVYELPKDLRGPALIQFWIRKTSKEQAAEWNDLTQAKLDVMFSGDATR